MTYTVIGRDPNSWTRTSKGDFHEIVYDCGHKHRTLAGAVKCLRSIRGTTDWLHANLEVYDKDQQIKGEQVDINSNEYQQAEHTCYRGRNHAV